MRAERRAGQLLKETAEAGQRATAGGNLKRGPKLHHVTSETTFGRHRHLQEAIL